MYNENPILCRGCAFMMHVTFGTPFHSSTHPGTRARHLHARAATLQRSSVQRILLSMPLLLFLGGCGTSEGQTTPGVRSTVPSSTEPTADMQESLPPAGHAWVIFGTDTVTAEVARTPGEGERGSCIGRGWLRAGYALRLPGQPGEVVLDEEHVHTPGHRVHGREPPASWTSRPCSPRARRPIPLPRPPCSRWRFPSAGSRRRGWRRCRGQGGLRPRVSQLLTRRGEFRIAGIVNAPPTRARQPGAGGWARLATPEGRFDPPSREPAPGRPACPGEYPGAWSPPRHRDLLWPPSSSSWPQWRPRVTPG